MKINNPFDTGFGSLINTVRISEELTRYLAVVDIDSLSYEYRIGSTNKLVFITGYSEEEKELPIWDHPLVFQDIKQNKIVAVDLRKYVKTDNEQPLYIRDIIRDKSSVDFLTLRALLTMDSINDQLGLHRAIFKNVASGMSGFIGSILNSIVGLDVVEKAYVEIAVGLYCNLAMVPNDDIEDILESVRARVIKTPYSLKIPEKRLREIVEKIPYKVESLEDMIKMIQIVLPEEKRNFVSETTIVNAVSNAFYGPGGSETIIMSLEHIPTWMALVYVGLENKSYKKSKLGTILQKEDKRIKSKEIIKHFEHYLKSSVV